MKTRYLFICLISFACSAIIMAFERLLGIGWDYHPDSVTYATQSIRTITTILENDKTQIFNNGYYFIIAVLDENIILATLYNMILFSITNVILYKIHTEKLLNLKNSFPIFLLLVLNPYRLHLSTTLLKDTTIIFLTILIAISFKNYLRFIILLVTTRVVAILYTLAFLKTKRQYTLFILFSLIIILLFSESIFKFLLDSNQYEMNFREFDNIPTFQNLGVPGIIFRAVSWALLSFTGIFAILSPALEYFMVALGITFNHIYCFKITGKIQIPIGLILGLMIFAALSPGFTTYIRYVYPLLTLLPILTLNDIQLHKNGRTSKK